MADSKAKHVNIDRKKLQQPDEIKSWIDGMKCWPKITLQEITIYLLESKTVDRQQLRTYRSLVSFNYFQNRWVGTVL